VKEIMQMATAGAVRIFRNYPL